jgi:hypothetical protein
MKRQFRDLQALSRQVQADKLKRLLAAPEASSSGAVAWADVSGKPSTFTPSTHSHPTSEVTGLDAALSGKQTTLVSGTNLKTVGGASLLGSGDVPIAGGSITEVTVDFATASPGQFFDVSVPGVTVGQKVMASPSIAMPAGVAEDELEMDPIFAFAAVNTADVVRLFVGAVGKGQIFGPRNINLMVA